jgi:peptidoglycan/xylan/chitin deacetylase (PgdA/CDA1 family)
MSMARRAPLFVMAAAAMAGGLAPLGLSPAHAEPCLAGTSALGVSRTVEIDTTGGPRYGAQYPGNEFLQDGEVVLTFDDGPTRSKTPTILSALAAHCTRATFFVVGRMALADPDLLQETARQGHTIALHTWSHRKLTATSAARAKDEIELGHSIVAKSLGAPVTPFFRFPYLAAPNSMLKYLGERNIANLGIDIDSKDFLTRRADVMVRNVLSQLQIKRKGIILFHDIQPSTAAGVKTLLDELKTRGFKVVHITSSTSVPTLPAYDKQAEALIARRHVASARKQQPIILGPDSTAPYSPGTGAAATEELPWLRGAPPQPAGPRPPPATSTPAGAKPWWKF